MPRFSVMDSIRLLSTDFDGTLIGHPGDGRCVPELADCLARFSASGGLWAVNTGRSLEHAIEGLEWFAAPVQPDFLLTNEREVFCRGEDGGWVDFGEWNAVCYGVHAELFSQESGIFDQIRAVLPVGPDVEIIEENGHPVGLITSDEEVMDRIVLPRLEPIRAVFHDFSWQRNTVYLRFCHAEYHKGAALGELSRLTEIPRNGIFAAGDHFNDLSMLCGKYAAHVACPANAIQPVKELVSRSGGHVSGRMFGAGIADALVTMGAV